VEIQLAPNPRSPGRARRFVREALGDSTGPQVVEDVQLVVSELVTNSVRHANLGADQAVTLSIERVDDLIRIEVRDRGRAFIRPAYTRSPSSEGGLGLRIVDRLSDSWGMDQPGIVWALVPADATRDTRGR
jgi:anti-sigma regulatory factor (Ser/Thr protein kinase)